MSAAITYSDVDARKKGEVSRKALAVAAPRASSEKLLKRIVVDDIWLQTSTGCPNGERVPGGMMVGDRLEDWPNGARRRSTQITGKA